jgi:RHS repeat-associated protein
MPPLTRPIVELLGQHRGYGFAGVGVSTAIGNFTQTTTDLVFPESLFGLLDWRRTYNSHSGAIGALGPGWATSLSASLVAPPPGTSGQVTFNDEDGRVLTFTPTADGGYTRPQDLPASLTRNADGSFTLAYDFGESWLFDATGRLSSRTREGQQVTLAYDNDLLGTATHSTGRELTFAYNANRRLTSVTSSDGRVVSFGYGAGTVTDSLLESVTVPGGGVIGYQSSGTGQGSQVSRITDADGNLVVANTYDETTAAVAGQQYPGGGGATFEYSQDGVTTVTSSPDGGQLTFQADANGRMTQLTQPGGGTATFGYDDNGYLTAATTPGGTQLNQTHDANGNLLTSTYGGATTAWTYDQDNRVTSVTGPTGGVTGFGYTGDSHVASTLTQPNGGVIEFSVTNGLVTQRTDAEGAVTLYGYDGSGNLISVTSPAGEVTSFGYDAVGNIVQVIAPSGATTQVQYDAAGQVTTVTNPDGDVTTFSYSPAGLLLQVTDPTNASISYAYNAAGQRISMTDALGRVTSYGYDPDGNLVTLTDSGGNVTTGEYDALGRLTQMTDPVQAVFSFSYDADGRVTTEQSPEGTASFGYDARGNLVSVTRPDGAQIAYGYDLASRLTSVTGPDGGTSTTSYDAMGQPVSSVNQLGAVSRQVWTPTGYLAATIDPLGRETTITRDTAGRVISVTDPEGGVTQYVYDQDGRQIAIISPAGLATRYRYDAAGKIVAVVSPGGWIFRYEYDKRGQTTAAITPSGAVQRWQYDAAGQLTVTTDPNGSQTQYVYDQAGNITSITDPKGSVTRFAYDAAGREISSTDPLGRTTTREYDKAGNLIAVTDPSGHTINLEYDNDGRVTRRSAGQESVSFAYDPAGNRISMTDATGTTRYTYDKAGQLTTLTYPDGEVLSMTYDAAGQRTGLTYPGGLTVSYFYDLNARLIAVHDSKAGDAAYALDPDGRLLTEQFPGRLEGRYHYEHGQLTRFTVYRDDHPVASTEFTHDPDGRIRLQLDGDDRLEFGYDPAGQLISALRRRADGSREDVHLTYDAAGNRTSMSRAGAETRYRYDDADQLVSLEARDRRAEFRYDSSGRLTGRTEGPRECVVDYDGLGLPSVLTRREGDRTERVTPVFDGSGLLASLVTTLEHGGNQHSASVRYRWSAGQIPQILAQVAGPELDDAERDRPGRLDADFSYGYGRAFASFADGAATFHHDAYGSQVRTDETAPWVQAEHYDAFGVPQDLPDQPGPSLPRFGYRGELALGSLEYLRARVYDAELGRFTSQDPVTVMYGPANGNNPYAYAANDPVDYGDPLGTFAFPFSALSDVLSFTLLSASGPCSGCPNVPNTDTRISKCFQNKKCLRTRGYFDDYPGALEGNLFALDLLATSYQPEKAAEALAINKLNNNRGGGLPVNPAIDWEVAINDEEKRTDIITAGPSAAASFLTELRVYRGPSTVLQLDVDIQGYIDNARTNWNNVVLRRSTELAAWLDVIPTNIFAINDIFTPQNLMFVWGGPAPGQAYYARGPRVPKPVRAREAKREPVPRRVPVKVPVRVPAPAPNPPVIAAPSPGFHLTPTEVKVGIVVLVGGAILATGGGAVLAVLAF